MTVLVIYRSTAVHSFVGIPLSDCSCRKLPSFSLSLSLSPSLPPSLALSLTHPLTLSPSIPLSSKQNIESTPIICMFFVLHTPVCIFWYNILQYIHILYSILMYVHILYFVLLFFLQELLYVQHPRTLWIQLLSSLAP